MAASHRRVVQSWCTMRLVRWLLKTVLKSHDGLRQRIPIFDCPDAVRLSVIPSVRSHSNQFMLVCIGATRRSGRQDKVDSTSLQRGRQLF